MDEPAVAIVGALPDSADARTLMRALDDELRRRYPLGAIHGLGPEDVGDPGLTFLVARVEDQGVGCGALRALEPGVGEIKRMFVRPGFRRRGVARQLLSALEAEARARGYVALRLETGARQRGAIGLYESAGYRRRSPFGEYVGNPQSLCFEKRLCSASRPGRGSGSRAFEKYTRQADSSRRASQRTTAAAAPRPAPGAPARHDSTRPVGYHAAHESRTRSRPGLGHHAHPRHDVRGRAPVPARSR